VRLAEAGKQVEAMAALLSQFTASMSMGAASATVTDL
jgi:hypothetical protein